MVINELLEVLFWRNINELIAAMRDLNSKYYPNEPDMHYKELCKFILNNIPSKMKLYDLIDDY